MYTRLSWPKHLLVSVIISLSLILPTYAQDIPEAIIIAQEYNHTLLRHQNVQSVATDLYSEVGLPRTKQVPDSIDLPHYLPPKVVIELAEQTDMSEEGRRIFYSNRPIIGTRKVGLDFCNLNHKRVFIGCFSPFKGIFIQEITDPRLVELMPVTAAHEMLHAVYEQLLGEEKVQLNKELHQFYSKLKNTEIKKIITNLQSEYSYYVDSELHSLLGTDIATLSPSLEKHYSRYFTDRSNVIAYAKQNGQIFSRIAGKANAIDKKLKIMKPIIDREEKAVKIATRIIERQRIQLEKIHNPEVYNSRLHKFNQGVNEYNQKVQMLKSLIVDYNKLVNNYNDLSAEEKSLSNALRGI
jgi:hypothetical protein